MSEIEEMKLYIQQLEDENKRLKDSNKSLRTNNKGLLQGITKIQRKVNKSNKKTSTEFTNEEIKILLTALKNLINKTSDVKMLLYTSQGIKNISKILRTYEELYEKLWKIGEIK